MFHEPLNRQAEPMPAPMLCQAVALGLAFLAFAAIALANVDAIAASLGLVA